MLARDPERDPRRSSPTTSGLPARGRDAAGPQGPHRRGPRRGNRQGRRRAPGARDAGRGDSSRAEAGRNAVPRRPDASPEILLAPTKEFRADGGAAGFDGGITRLLALVGRSGRIGGGKVTPPPPLSRGTGLLDSFVRRRREPGQQPPRAPRATNPRRAIGGGCRVLPRLRSRLCSTTVRRDGFTDARQRPRTRQSHVLERRPRLRLHRARQRRRSALCAHQQLPARRASGRRRSACGSSSNQSPRRAIRAVSVRSTFNF